MRTAMRNAPLHPSFLLYKWGLDLIITKELFCSVEDRSGRFAFYDRYNQHKTWRSSDISVTCVCWNVSDYINESVNLQWLTQGVDSFAAVALEINTKRQSQEELQTPNSALLKSIFCEVDVKRNVFWTNYENCFWLTSFLEHIKHIILTGEQNITSALPNVSCYCLS